MMFVSLLYLEVVYLLAIIRDLCFILNLCGGIVGLEKLCREDLYHTFLIVCLGMCFGYFDLGMNLILN